jgi:hypothetical protein
MRGKIGAAFTLWRTLRLTRRGRIAIGLLMITLAILVSAAIVAPFYYSDMAGAPPGAIRFTHDMLIHLSVMDNFDKMLRAGAIYPRWLSDVNFGYGNAWPNFYQPGFYFLTSLVNAITHNWIDTLFVITTLALALSGLAFYVLARAFFGRPASAIAAVLYALLPYHLLDVFWRGAMPEYLSFVLLPLILYFFYRLGRNQGQARDYAMLGLCYGLCLMIHVPIGYLFSYLLVSYALTWAVVERDWRIAGRIALGMSIGVLLSAIYWLPAVAEIKYATETVTKLFEYHKNYITQLPGAQGYDLLLRETFAIQAIALLVVVVAWRLLNRRALESFNDSQAQAARGMRLSHTGMWIIMGILAIFMNLPFSYYLARLIPKIEIVAFPSRWLVFVCLFTALLTAAVVDRLAKRVRRSANRGWADYVAFAATVAVVVVNLWFTSQEIIGGSLDNPLTVPDANFLADTYCPNGAGPAASLPRTDAIVVKPRTASSEVIRWEPLYRQAVINADETTSVRFKTFNFPGWTARIDGAAAPIASDPACAQLISVPPGRHTVEISFAGTLPRHLGAAFSVAGILIVCGLTLAGSLWPRRQSESREAEADREPSEGEDLALTQAGQAQEINRQPAAGGAQERFRHKAVIRHIADFCLGGVILAGGIFCVVMLSDDLGIRDKTNQAPHAMRSAFRAGSDARLSVGTAKVITVAVDEQSLYETIEAMSRRDDQKIESLLQSGKAFRVEPDTKVRLLELGNGQVKVKILEGSNALREGWVPEGWLK